jgi:hypothetical protein
MTVDEERLLHFIENIEFQVFGDFGGEQVQTKRVNRGIYTSAIPWISPNSSLQRETMRSFNSAAVFSVKVNATMLLGRQPFLRRYPTCLAMTSVLPEPAHASAHALFNLSN